MSILAEMLAEFCPNGVELKKVADVTTVARGIRVVRNQLVEEGEFPVYQNSMKPLGYYEKANCPAKTTFVIGAGAAGEIGYCDIDFWAADDCYYFIHTEELDNRYLYHVLLSRKAQICSKVRRASVPRLARTVIENLVIPIPPIEIQHEIVRILDNFTELTKELTKELTARKKQFEYYRDKLLGFDISIPKVRLRNIAKDIYRGSGITREQVTEDGIPCVRYGEIYTTYNIWFDECKSHTTIENIANPKYFEYGDILFAITGESVEDIAKSTAYVGNEKCLAGGDIVVLKHNQNPKYLSYVLSTHNAQQQKSKGKIKSKVVHSSVPAIEEIEIPLPDLEIQNRLVNVLDNFDAICTDLNIGLPAEIEARQRQYEYYRDLLLTFVEQGNTILTDRQTDRQTLIKLLQYVFGTVYVRLGDIATITRGGNFQKRDFVTNGFPCIHYGQIYTSYGIYADKTITNISEDAAEKSKKAAKNDIIMAVTSENIDDVCKCVAWLGEHEIAVSGHTAIVHHEQNPKFLAYYFHAQDFIKQKKKLAHGTKVIEVTPDKLNDIIVPLPSKEEQEHIVSVLDHFDFLCNDLSNGLPAEIEARQKQYEYYRDKLLEFKEVVD